MVYCLHVRKKGNPCALFQLRRDLLCCFFATSHLWLNVSAVVDS